MHIRAILVLLLAAILTVSQAAISGFSLRSKAVHAKKHAYAAFGIGYSRFSMEHLNAYFIDAYSPVYDDHVKNGTVLDAELGMFITERFALGLSYVFAKGVTEGDTTLGFNDRDNQTVEWSDWYLDSYFRGVGIGVRYYPFMLRKIRVFAGLKTLLGFGVVNMGMGQRPDVLRGDYGYDNFHGEGVGGSILAGIEVFPVPAFCFGMKSGYRVLRTTVLTSSIDGAPWQRPSDNPHNINLDFSGFLVMATVGLEL